MTDFLIITSTEDLASMNMREILLNDNLLKFKELSIKWHENPLMQLEMIMAKRDFSSFFSNNNIFMGLTDNPLIFLDDLKLNTTEFNPDLLIFASRHRSEAVKLAFLTHSTGNWSDDAQYGGSPRKLSKTSAILLKAAFHNLVLQKEIKKIAQFIVDMEVTHHGPTKLIKPLIFMELGSSEEEWTQMEPGKAVAHSILNTCVDYTKFIEEKMPTIGIGFGGTHYAPQFRKLILNHNVAMAFICPKYHVRSVDENLVIQMIENTLEKVDCFIIDWKGLNSYDKKHLIPILEEFDIPIKKTKEF